MNITVGKDLIQGKQAFQRIQYDQALRQSAIDKAVYRGQVDSANYLSGIKDQRFNREEEMEYAKSFNRKERLSQAALSKSLIKELMGRSKFMDYDAIESRLDGLSMGQQQAIKNALPGADENDIQDAIQNGLNKLTAKKPSKTVTKAELEKIVDDAVNKLSANLAQPIVPIVPAFVPLPPSPPSTPTPSPPVPNPTPPPIPPKSKPKPAPVPKPAPAAPTQATGSPATGSPPTPQQLKDRILKEYDDAITKIGITVDKKEMKKASPINQPIRYKKGEKVYKYKTNQDIADLRQEMQQQLGITGSDADQKFNDAMLNAGLSLGLIPGIKATKYITPTTHGTGLKLGFGKFLIDIAKLKKHNILSITYLNKTKVPGFPNVQVSDNLKNVILKKQVNTKKVNLTNTEKLFLQKLIKKADADIGKSKQTAISGAHMGTVDELKEELELLMGHISACNDNPQVLKELVQNLQKLVMLGAITQKQAKALLQTL